MESTSTLSRVHRTQAGWRLWLRWVVANALGFGIGFPLGMLPLLQREGGTDIGVSFSVGILGWIVMGLSVGIMQWLALRQVVSGTRWIVATIVGWSAGLGISVALPLAGIPAVLPHYLGMPGLGFALGAGAGILQALVLRCSVERAIVWVLANMAGWAAGWALWLHLPSLITSLFSIIRTDASVFAAGAVVGTVGGVITGLALVWVLRPGGDAASN